MRTFESLNDIALELKKKNLERQILREQIKQQCLGFQRSWHAIPLIVKLSRMGIQYLIKRLTQ